MWRVWWPFAELRNRGFVADSFHKDQAEAILPLVAAGRYDCVVTPRIVWPVDGIGTKWIKAVHNAGLAWVYEVDDDVFSEHIVPRQSALFESEREKGFEQLEWERTERIRMLSVCDGVTVTSPRLKTVITNHNPDVPVYVVPNAIDVKWFRLVMRGIGRVPELEGKLVIGWAGGTRLPADIAPLVKAWPIIAERYPDVMFALQGHLEPALVDCVPKERRVTMPWLPLDEYPRALINFDIGCCPVAPTSFNHSKSCIKWYEMTLAGMPTVVSPTLYGREVTDGVDALVADSPEEWVTQLSRLIESYELREKINREARMNVVTNHSLEANWWRWPEAWADAVDRFRSRLVTPDGVRIHKTLAANANAQPEPASLQAAQPA